MGHINSVVPVAHIWYFRSLPNKIGYLLGLPTKKLDMIIYYERYVVINAGVAAQGGTQYLDFLSEEEYLNLLDTLPKENALLEDDDFMLKPTSKVIWLGKKPLVSHSSTTKKGQMLQTANLTFHDKKETFSII
jgi:DNA-directed RNA polymerase beta' subunit